MFQSSFPFRSQKLSFYKYTNNSLSMSTKYLIWIHQVLQVKSFLLVIIDTSRKCERWGTRFAPYSPPALSPWANLDAAENSLCYFLAMAVPGIKIARREWLGMQRRLTHTSRALWRNSAHSLTPGTDHPGNGQMTTPDPADSIPVQHSCFLSSEHLRLIQVSVIKNRGRWRCLQWVSK